jgi:predicted ATPase/DNA-binding CsgD family transcriptional regulator
MAATAQRPASQREAEVLALLGEHLSNAQIAGRLHISVRTVENHVSSLLRKYGAADRHALARFAAPAGPGQPGVAHLPAARTAFIGRAHERDMVLALLARARLATLVGPGGVGKTRLAAVISQDAVANYPLGGTFVDLVPVRDSLVSQAVAAALGITERPEQPLRDAVTARLGRGRSLLILDNCEHVLDAVAELADHVLASCPGTTILATSRERLGVPGERAVPVAPLPLASDAEALFTERAAAADPGFITDPALVARICSRLDGMPLAIELAAARCASLGVSGLLDALGDTLRVVAGGRDPDQRHRSLRAVIGWSHDLLADDQRALFRCLAVFRGSFDLTAAVAVAPDGGPSAVADVLGRLVDKSLVVHERAERRWRLLDTIRAFALEQLARSGEQDLIEDRYRRWAADTADTAAAAQARPAGRWQAGFDAVADDLRAALASCPPGKDALAHRLARSLGQLCYARRFLTEALGHFDEAARRAPTPGEAAADLRTAAQAGYATGLASRSFDLLLTAAGQAQAAGDGDSRAIALAGAVIAASRFPSGFPEQIPVERLRQLLAEAAAAGDRGTPAVAARLTAATAWLSGQPSSAPDPELAEAAAAAARSTGDPVLISGALDALATVHARSGGLRDAYQLACERLRLLETMDRHEPRAAAEILDAYHGAWLSAIATGDLPAALAIAHRISGDELLGGHPYRPASKLIPPLVLMGRFDDAFRHADVMWEGWQRSGTPIAAWAAVAASAVSLAHGLLGNEEGRRIWRARAAPAQGTGNPAAARNNAGFAAFADVRLAVHAGAAGDPATLIGQALARSAGGWHEPYTRAATAELAVVAGLPGAEEQLAAAATAAQQNDWAAACLTRAAGRLRGDRPALTASAGQWERIGAWFERDCTLTLAGRGQQQ